jgi:hypothetical protein
MRKPATKKKSTAPQGKDASATPRSRPASSSASERARRKELDEVRQALEALRAGLRESVGQYLARIDGRLASLVAHLDKAAKKDGGRVLRLERKTLRRVKPPKGRVKDLAKFEGLADKLEDLLK